jgi:hypothetical protein
VGEKNSRKKAYEALQPRRLYQWQKLPAKYVGWPNIHFEIKKKTLKHWIIILWLSICMHRIPSAHECIWLKIEEYFRWLEMTIRHSDLKREVKVKILDGDHTLFLTIRNYFIPGIDTPHICNCSSDNPETSNNNFKKHSIGETL